MRSNTKTLLMGILMLILVMAGVQRANAVITQVPSEANEEIVNGFNDNDNGDADGPGELTVNISGVVTGIPTESLLVTDTITVESVFAFSSLESLGTPDAQATSYDTVYQLYRIQNYGNTASDSFYAVAAIIDTSQTGHFVPTDFDIVQDTSGADNVVSTSVSKDTCEFGFRIAEAAIETLFFRVVIPAPDSAADQDSIHVHVELKGNVGSGTDDSWPGGNVILDTTGSTYIYTSNDTLLDFGDTQHDTVRILIGGPNLRLRKITSTLSGTKPGDTLQYVIWYDNDGSAASEDTAFIIDYFPVGVAFLDTVYNRLDTNTTRGGGDKIDVDYYYQPTGAWLDDLPQLPKQDAARDTIWHISGIRFAIPPGIGEELTSNRPDSTYSTATVADDSMDTDAGYMSFRVRIR